MNFLVSKGYGREESAVCAELHPTMQAAMDAMLAQQFHSMEQMQQDIARRRRPPTRGSVLPTSVIQTPQRLHDAKGTSLEPSTDGFMVREAWQVVGADVQCLFKDAPHRKSCANFVAGAQKDGRPCACKWWDVKITQDNKD